MLNLIQAIELAKKLICSKCTFDCRQCPWTAEDAIRKIQRTANED